MKPTLLRLFFRYNSRPVAVKIIQPTRASEVSADRKEKFQREVLLLSNMKHEAVVKVSFSIALEAFFVRACVLSIYVPLLNFPSESVLYVKDVNGTLLACF